MDINSPVVFEGDYTFKFKGVYVTVYWTVAHRWCVRVLITRNGRSKFLYTDPVENDTYRSVILRATGRKRLWAQ